MKHLPFLVAMFALLVAPAAQAEEEIAQACVLAAERMLDIAAEETEITPERRAELLPQLAAQLAGAEMPMCGMMLLMPDTTMRAFARQAFARPATPESGAKSE